MARVSMIGQSILLFAIGEVAFFISCLFILLFIYSFLFFYFFFYFILLAMWVGPFNIRVSQD